MRLKYIAVMILICASALCVSAGSETIDKLKGDDVKGTVAGKKMILATTEFYTTPAAKLAKMIGRMQDVTFDGVTINFFPENIGCMSHRWWGTVPYSYDMFKPEIDIYRSLKWGRYTDNLLWSSSMTGGTGHPPLNWFDTNHIGIWLKNTELFGRVAKDAGAKGVVLDTEQYGGGDYGVWRLAFSYELYAASDYKLDQTQPDKPRSFAECAKQFRECGRKWIEAVSKGYGDDIVVLALPGMHSVARDAVIRFDDPTKRGGNSDYRLQAAFFDGVLEGLPEEATLVDGRENCYPLMEYRDFAFQRDIVLRQSTKLSSVPELYNKRVTFGVGLWPDQNMIWDLDNLARNHKSPLQMEHTLYNAMVASDKYVWLWSSKVFFFPENISPNLEKYRQAVRNARKPHDLEWKQGVSFSGYDSAEESHYVDGADLDVLLTRTDELFKLPLSGWKFGPDPKKQGVDAGYFKKDFDDSKWKEIKIGECWETQGYPSLSGNGWYRQNITFPELPEGKKVYMYFAAVDESTWLYIDGELIAWHDKFPLSIWDKPFTLDITGTVKSGSTQQITVRVNDVGGAGGIWKPVKIIVEK